VNHEIRIRCSRPRPKIAASTLPEPPEFQNEIFVDRNLDSW